MAKKITNEVIKERLKNKVGDEYTLVSNYKGGNRKIDLLHSICGKVYSVTPNHFFYDNTRCRCQWNIKQPEVFKKEFEDIAKGNYTQLSDHRRSNEKIKIKHNICDNKFYMETKSFLRGQGCPKRYGNRVKTTEEFSKEVDELSDGSFFLESEYINNRLKVRIRHLECDGVYLVTPKDYIRGNRCPYCKQSKGERLVRGILDKHKIQYEIEKVYDNLKVRNQSLPYDFYIPSYNLLIEYDGVQHFKPVQYFGGLKKLKSQKRRDNLKNLYAKENGINLLRIPYTY